MLLRPIGAVLLLAACGRRAPPPEDMGRASQDAAAIAAGVTALPTPGPRDVIVRLTEPLGTRTVELFCDAEARARAPLVTDSTGAVGVARLEGASGTCQLFFKGGAPATFGPVEPGQALDCVLQATTAVCVPAVPGSAPSFSP